MQNFITRVTLLLILIGVPFQAMAQEGEGRLSLVTNPQVMVYIDGTRVGMTPLINRSMTPGEHRMALLLILPNGNRLRADYRLMIQAGQETSASLDMVRNAPTEGEVRTLGPAVAAAPPEAPPANPPANPPEAPPANPPANTGPPANPPLSGGWATNPGQPSHAPVTVAPPPQNPPPAAPTPPPAPPEPQESYSLSREMVREGLEALRTVIQACMDGRHGVVQVRLVIQPDGGVAEVEAQGVYRGTNAGECIERQVPEEAAFPIYDGDPIPVVYPYRFAPQ